MVVYESRPMRAVWMLQYALLRLKAPVLAGVALRACAASIAQDASKYSRWCYGPCCCSCACVLDQAKRVVGPCRGCLIVKKVGMAVYVDE